MHYHLAPATKRLVPTGMSPVLPLSNQLEHQLHCTVDSLSECSCHQQSVFISLQDMYVCTLHSVIAALGADLGAALSGKAEAEHALRHHKVLPIPDWCCCNSVT